MLAGLYRGGLVGGLIGGVIAAGAANATAQQEAAAAQQHAASCAQRYRSYDPASNRLRQRTAGDIPDSRCSRSSRNCIC
ncbi:BA14K family protein [Bradyrhizobium septentrionale]|uniref:Lectin-like protein BA14k n=1 Tax=Bradyrhizobium septentrionale TaxID=1404411 RepID=A0ABZ2NUX1_9BRAD|nr:BA14K family protein [Bradyrhizobium septentrionale]UGY12424.1 BA14K family protein [Bradyrhizobium septentrionale]UGY21063.1 BA14K family protein [Bradyrhizobium septentrionale]